MKDICYLDSTLRIRPLIVSLGAPQGFFMSKNIRVFVIAFSLKALYRPIGKESKSELIPGEISEHFTQTRLKKWGHCLATATPDLQSRSEALQI